MANANHANYSKIDANVLFVRENQHKYYSRVHLVVKDLPARAASCRKRLYQPGCAAGRSVGMRPPGRGREGRLMLKFFLIIAVVELRRW